MENDFWNKKNVLITGCFGFLASSLIIELLKKGARVTGIAQDSTTESLLLIGEFDKKIDIAYGSITDSAFMERIFNQYEIQICFHLAALATVGPTKNSPPLAFEANIKGTWAVLEAARRCQTLQGIVVASSDKAYGTQKQLPYTEDQQLLGHFPYDVSKACADMIAQSYFHTFNLPVAVTRCANIYGPGDLHWSRIIPGTIRSVLFNEQPIIRSDGSPIRDYLYVKDAVDAYIAIAENINKEEVKGNAFNFTGESPINVLSLVNRIILISGKKMDAKVTGEGIPYAEIDKQYLSCEKAKRSLNWKAQYSLEEGLKETINWYKNYFKQ